MISGYLKGRSLWQTIVKGSDPKVIVKALSFYPEGCGVSDSRAKYH